MIGTPYGVDLSNADDKGFSNTDNVTHKKTAGTRFQVSACVAAEENPTNRVPQGGFHVNGQLTGGWSTSHKKGCPGSDWELGTELNLAEGTYTVRARARILHGSLREAYQVYSPISTDFITIVVDNTAPTTTPGSLSTTTTSTFTGVASNDPESGDYISLYQKYPGGSEIPIGVTSTFSGANGREWSVDADFLWAPGLPSTFEVRAYYTDLAGNQNTSYSSTSVSTNSVAPSVRASGLDLDASDDTGISNTDNLTRTRSSLTFHGTLTGAPSLGDYVQLYRAGNIISGASTSNFTGANHSWTIDSVNIPLHLPDIPHTFTAALTNSADTDPVQSTNLIVVIDTTNPPAGNVGDLDLAASDDDGSSDSDNITTATTGLTISGTLSRDPDTAGGDAEHVQLYRGNTLISGATDQTFTGSPGRNWSIDIDLAEGVHNITGRLRNKAGGSRGDSARSLTITVDDGIAPTNSPGTLYLSALDDTGIYFDDRVTGTSTDLTISGTLSGNATSGEYVQLYNGNTKITGANTSNFIGTPARNWSIDFDLAEGTHNIKAFVLDQIGDKGPTSSMTIVVDTTAPTITTSVPNLATSSDSGVSSTDDITNQTTGLAFTGTISGDASTGDHVQLYNGDEMINRAFTSNFTGANSREWTINNVDLSAGTHNISAKVVDLAGNSSTVSTALEVTIDNIPPVANAGALDLATEDDTGISNSDNNTGQTTGLTISGTLTTDPATGEYVQLYNGTNMISGATDDTFTGTPARDWSIDIDLAEDSHNIKAYVMDKAGNQSTVNSLAITVDSTDPTITPGALDLATEDDTGVSSVDNITNATTSLTISGTLSGTPVPGDFIQLYNGTTLLTGKTDDTFNSNQWAIDIDLVEGTHTINAYVMDKTGNRGTVNSLEIIVDTTGPNIDSGPLDLATEDDTKPDQSDNITWLTTGLTISGTLSGNPSAGDHVQLYNNQQAIPGTMFTTFTGPNNQDWSIDIDLPQGEHVITAYLMDLAGNPSASNSLAITVTKKPKRSSGGVRLIRDGTANTTTPTTTVPDELLSPDEALRQALLDVIRAELVYRIQMIIQHSNPSDEEMQFLVKLQEVIENSLGSPT